MNNPIDSFSFFLHHSGKNINKFLPAPIDFYHLFLVLEGSFTYIVEGKEIVLEENDALLLVPGTIRERHFNPNYAHYVHFNYMPTKGNEVQSNILFKNGVNQTIRRLLDSYPYNNHLKANQLSSASFEIEKNKLVLQNILNCVIIELFDSLKYKTQNAHVLKAINYINDNITAPLTLTHVSDALHISREYTARIFKQEMGLTVSEFINQQKLNLAKNMLTNNALTVQDVAYKVGYENYCYFSKLFKNQFGVSPLKMKKELS